MSRYQSVRPRSAKPQSAHPQPPAQPAAAPSPAQMEKVALERFNAAFHAIYKLRDGDLLDASIERWKRTLELFDREQKEVIEKSSEGHRWMVSPTIALRTDMYLQKMIERREKLKIECYAEAKEAVAQVMAGLTAGAESLCPPKSAEPATQADSGPQADAEQAPAPAHAPAPRKGVPADATPIAA